MASTPTARRQQPADTVIIIFCFLSIDQGQLATYYTELYHDFNLGWWKVIGGAVDFDYTGLYNSESCGWWLVGTGEVALYYEGTWNDTKYGDWEVSGGSVVF